ncbi:helix-turn-helix domain-containing protein [Sphingomonas japonica]|uniref:CRP-like cAMP-binding protein n=1 Tax=Sphingomonas japonica TaxID=511662 RepID=A0ABX0TZV0_9SPHN|nr:helix-turn-helix domain-containing protein [Sphingomonas japonica]NIJ22986.1 CRP-like cAMP-binding protein [Sphingomonas japonica]
MQDTIECASLFASQQRPNQPQSEAGAAMMAAGRASRWRRNQACDAVIARGAVACIGTGAVRKFALRPNGQRQIIDLALAGDYVGFAPADPGFFFEAVSNDTVILSFTREQIDGLVARFPAIAALMQRCTADAIRRLEHHLLVQNRMTAREKVSAYLAEMSHRIERRGTNAIVLPITRYDIADHLGIAVETVSRTMTVLCQRGSITLRTPRVVEIRDPSMLSETEC